MSEDFFAIFPYTWGHVSFQFLPVFGSLLCTFVLLLALVCFPGIPSNPGINVSLNFPEEYPHTKASVSNVEFTSDILGDVKKILLTNSVFSNVLCFCCCCSQVLFSHPSPNILTPFQFLFSPCCACAAPYPVQFPILLWLCRTVYLFSETTRWRLTPRPVDCVENLEGLKFTSSAYQSMFVVNDGAFSLGEIAS